MSPRATIMPPSVELREILFFYDGDMDIATVPPTLRGINLRKHIAKQLNLKMHLKQVRLIVLQREDGSWATQDDMATVAGKEIQYPMSIATSLPPTNQTNMFHVRVEIVEEPAKQDAEAEESASDYDTDGGRISSAEEAMEDWNRRLLATSKKRKASNENIQLSKCDKDTTTASFKLMRVSTYTEEPETLPEQYLDAIKAEYRKNVLVWSRPWGLNEQGRRSFIDSVLTNCIAPINEKLLAKAKDDDEYRKQRLELSAEVELKRDGMTAIGKADYVIQRGDRMVVVIEAKRCDMTQAKHQNFAVMETARVLNKRKNKYYRAIKGICTDFQNWTFVSRERRSICMDDTSMIVTKGLELPFNLANIVNKVYGMLTRL